MTENEALTAFRMVSQAVLNSRPGTRESLAAEWPENGGGVWDTEELGRDFTVEGFLAPYVVVRRISDGVRGSLMFQHHPRLYFAWTPDGEPGPETL